MSEWMRESVGMLWDAQPKSAQKKHSDRDTCVVKGSRGAVGDLSKLSKDVMSRKRVVNRKFDL